MCSRVTTNKNSHITVDTTCTNATTSPCKFQEKVVIQCDMGYEISEGHNNVTLTCQADMAYDNAPPVCQSMYTY